MRGTVVLVRGGLVAEVVRIASRGPVDAALNGLRVRIEQQLGGVAAKAAAGVPWPGHAVVVPLARTDRWEISVPAEGVDLIQVQPPLRAVIAEKAQLNPLGNLGEEREVRSHAVVGSAQRIRLARPGIDGVRHITPCRTAQSGSRSSTRARTGPSAALPRAGPAAKRSRSALGQVRPAPRPECLGYFPATSRRCGQLPSDL